MSNKKEIIELKKAVEKIKNTIESLKVEDEKSMGRWVPKEGEKYYRVSVCGSVVYTDHVSDNALDSYQKKIGNQFKTSQLAQTQLDCITKIHTINNYIREQNGDWVADWRNSDENKFYLYFDNLEDNVCFGQCFSYQEFVFIEHCSSVELARQVIEKFKEDILFIHKNYRK